MSATARLYPPSQAGTGGVTVLRATNAQFTHAAIDAVKRWRYTPLPHEGIVTVAVNFNVQS